jgi:chaperonin cofactor prefoldin
MPYETQSFEQVNQELLALDEKVQVLLTDIGVAIARIPDLTGAMADLETIKSNIELRISAVEDRLTARETAHHALVSQLNDVLGQMQVKLQGALELKPEIMPYDNALAAGYTDETTGIKLRADSTAQRKFTSQLLILRTAVEYGGAPTNMPVQIWDYNGAVQSLSFTDYVGLMLRFGVWVAAVEARF